MNILILFILMMYFGSNIDQDHHQTDPIILALTRLYYAALWPHTFIEGWRKYDAHQFRYAKTLWIFLHFSHTNIKEGWTMNKVYFNWNLYKNNSCISNESNFNCAEFCKSLYHIIQTKGLLGILKDPCRITLTKEFGSLRLKQIVWVGWGI